jgi:LPXTG-site transpeptidase (sortase) family protein
MQSKIFLGQILLTAIFAGFALPSVFFFYFSLPDSGLLVTGQAQSVLALSSKNTAGLLNQTRVLSNQRQLPLEEDRVVFGLPVRLKIPRIGINSVVERVGLTPGGAMGVPKSTNTVAWFELGQRPGEKGSAVIAGHFGIKNGKASVFDNLYKLRKGDKIYIEDNKGKIISFVVRESRRYDPGANAQAVFGSSDGKAHLNLVTCEGTWNKISKSYPKRLVIFTDKE